ncbi:FAD-binding oxidoreductase [Hydrogenophaga sp.]|uniref:NAD(P)/FAD-dependent oxidoreductase n=1 Tax=Hydrogenophaga sp. TaxID=1904254 RepID=UPI002605B702|nr:FAD-binding oxidoreductase [Hydrogenophaga sp.]
MANHNNYWFGTCPTRSRVASGLVRNADVLIIGGGVAGMSLLYNLVNAGITNTYLVEENTVASHASGRSSGQLMLRGSKLFHELGDDVGAEYLAFIGENNRRFIKGLRAAGFDTDLRDTGGLRLAATEDELEKLNLESKFILEHRKLNCPIMSKAEIQGILPQTGFAGGMFVPTEATFNPYKVVNGLRELVEKKGPRVLTDCQVTGVKQEDKSLAVSIRHKGVIRAKRVVYCLNAYTPELLPELAEVMTPYRGQMIATEYLEDSVAQLLPQMSMTCNDCHEYFRLHNGRLLVGGMRHAVRGQQMGLINDGEISPGVFDKLRSFVAGALPFVQNVKFSHTWSGIMCATPDSLPLIGNVPGRENEYILGGFNGYGFGHALHGSMIIKDLIKTGTSTHPGVQLFDPGRF